MEHLEQIRAAIDAIEARLPERPRVDELAAAAGLSPWHFQRVFRALVGESVGGYIRKRLLSRTIPALLDTDQRILDIAIEHGFDSQEAYSRAFRAVFELPPGRFRARGQRAVGLAVPDGEALRLRGLGRIERAEPRLVELPETHYVGARGRFVSLLAEEPDAAAPVGELWRRFEHESRAIRGRLDADAYGLCLPLPADAREREYELEYMAGARVAAGEPTPAGLDSHTSPASLYAVFEHRGGLDALGATLATALFGWLPESEFTHAVGAEFERYVGGYGPTHGHGPQEFWLAVQPEKRA